MDPVNPADPAAPVAAPLAAPAQPAPVAPAAAQPPAPPVAAPPPPVEAQAPAVDPLRAELDGVMAAFRESVAEQLAAVPEGVRRAVLALAGDSPTRQREVLSTMRANGLVAAPTPPPAPIPVGATTGAQPGPLPTAAAALDVDPDVQAFRQWQALRSDGAATTAAALYTANAAAIQRGRSKASASN